MSEIRFYHLERQELEEVLPALLTKALESGSRVIVKTSTEQEAERLNAYLWTFDSNSFLPHGSKKDGMAEYQPIWLTAENDNPNKADVIILTQGTQCDNPGDYRLCCEMLEGKNQQSVENARQRWALLKKEGHTVTYWQQSPQGRWEKKS